MKSFLSYHLSFGLFFLSFPFIASSQPLSYSLDSTTFQALIDFEGGECEFEFADINNDGHLDILNVGDHGSPFINTQQFGITVLFGNGTGTGWTMVQNGNLGYGGIAVGDVNNDGFADVGYGIHHNYAATDLGDQVMEVALGDGTANNWTPYDDSLGMQGQTYGMFGTDFADIDNDGLLDIGSNSFGCCDGIHVNRNLGTGVWPQSYGFIGGNSNQWFQFGDIDNDGYMDFAACRQGGTVYFGNGTGQFTLNDTGLPASGIVGYDFLHLANVDNDPQLEMGFCINGGIFIYKWNTTLLQWQNISGNLPASGSNYVMRLADMNGDGITDVVSFSTGILSVFTGNGNNTYTLAVTKSVPNMDFPRYAEVADIDHSGRPDILMFGRYPLGLFNSINKLILFMENSQPLVNNIASITPDSGQCYPNGAVRFITWQSTLVPGIQGLVTLELLTAGGSGLWDTLASGIPDNGSFQWTVPAGINSSYCIIRYTLADSTGSTVYATDLSAPFNIGCSTTTALHSKEGRWMGYPNPASDHFTVQFPAPTTRKSVLRITDIAGRERLNLVLEQGVLSKTLDISTLPSGSYLVTGEPWGNRTHLVVTH